MSGDKQQPEQQQKMPRGLVMFLLVFVLVTVALAVFGILEPQAHVRRSR